mmetsp:Transcript_1522/g.3925  ORF Transcript_1522/g.3925 Transcript_1522/m.3925 type:complete len:270 (-) Transcript_1522:312-1121(-)
MVAMTRWRWSSTSSISPRSASVVFAAFSVSPPSQHTRATVSSASSLKRLSRSVSAPSASRANRLSARVRPPSRDARGKPRQRSHVSTLRRMLVPSVITHATRTAWAVDAARWPQVPGAPTVSLAYAAAREKARCLHAMMTKTSLRSLYTAADVRSSSCTAADASIARYTASHGHTCTASSAITNEPRWRGPLRITGVSSSSTEPMVAAPNLARRLPSSTRAAVRTGVDESDDLAWKSGGGTHVCDGGRRKFRLERGAGGERGSSGFCAR